MPDDEKNPLAVDYRWIIAIVFLSLGLCFIFDVWGKIRIVRENPAVAERFIANDTVRDPLDKVPLLKQAGFTYQCNSCHQYLELSKEPKKLLAAHQNIVLEHGSNKSCYTCHHSTQYESLVIRDGSKLPFDKSALLCQQCHGPKHRDWLIGVHGRPNGYWDKTKGESIKATCVACHNPHSPKFKPMEPAPPPVEPHAMERDK